MHLKLARSTRNGPVPIIVNLDRVSYYVPLDEGEETPPRTLIVFDRGFTMTVAEPLDVIEAKLRRLAQPDAATEPAVAKPVRLKAVRST